MRADRSGKEPTQNCPSPNQPLEAAADPTRPSAGRLTARQGPVPE